MVNLQQVERALQALEDALLTRGIELGTYEAIGFLYGLLRHVLAKLQAFFNNEENAVDDTTAYILGMFLRQKTEELRRIAEEIDADYMK